MRKGLVTAAIAAAIVLAFGPPAVAAPRGCDPLDPAHCLLPWPNDHFREHGRLALSDEMMPRNLAGTPIAAADYNRSDGFSPGSSLVTLVPGLDLGRSGAAPVTDMGRSLAPDQPIVVIDARTRERQLIWSELNMVAEDPAERVLLVHPGANWREGRRYIVALRNLRDGDGQPIPAGEAFRAYRDRLPLDSTAARRRRPHMERIFHTLDRAGVEREELYLAWDFTVASERSLSQRLLSMRDRAFGELGDRNLRDLEVRGAAPAFSVDSVQQEGDVRRITGRFEVPCFLDQPGCPPGSRFRLDRRGLPVRMAGNTQQANFVCLVPQSSAATPRRALIFGHGLFGTAGAVGSLAPLAQLANIVACATDWSGMSREDVPNALQVSGDLSRFPSLADRLQQGILDFMFLGRLMLHPHGFSSHPEFSGRIDRGELFFAGGSLGGILGGALTAVAPDYERGALLVPGMNFSLLTTRSTQFRPFGEVIYANYPDRVEQAVVLSLVQTLWDRGEANGYAWHMTEDPYRNTPEHTVLLHEAFGDHQVANVATETEARVIGARLRTPALDPGRSIDRVPFYGIEPIPSYPWDDNALVVYDIGPLRPPGCGAPGAPTCLGTPPPPPFNVPPEIGVDPHGITPFTPSAVVAYERFLRTNGAFVDTCGASPCYAAGWTGP